MQDSTSEVMLAGKRQLLISQCGMNVGRETMTELVRF